MYSGKIALAGFYTPVQHDGPGADNRPASTFEELYANVELVEHAVSTYDAHVRALQIARGVLAVARAQLKNYCPDGHGREPRAQLSPCVVCVANEDVVAAMDEIDDALGEGAP